MWTCTARSSTTHSPAHSTRVRRGRPFVFLCPASLPREGPSVIEYKVSSFCSFGNCVEVGRSPEGAVMVRDTKDRAQELTFTDEEWVAFVAGVKAGEFDFA